MEFLFEHSTSVIIAYLAFCVVIIYLRIQWHLERRDCDLGEFVGFLFTGFVPILNIVTLLVAMSERYGGFWSDTIVIVRKSRKPLRIQSGLSKLLHPTKIEIITLPQTTKYMIRRTIKWFRLFSSVRFLSLAHSSPTWRKWDEEVISLCSISDLDKVTTAFILVSGAPNTAVELGGRSVDLQEMAFMMQLAQLDEGMRDLLSQATTYWLLKAKDLS